MLTNNKKQLTEYINNKENKMFINSKFKALKDNFYAPPTPG